MGSGNDVGHAYVLDGYATMKLGGDDVFHFNFGWGGFCNGYYYSTYQDLRESRPYRFDTSLEALIDFVPDKTGTSSDIYGLQYVYHWVDLPGMAFEQPFHYSNPFWVRISFGNGGNITYNGKIKAKLLSKSGVEKADFSINDDSELAVTGLATDGLRNLPVSLKLNGSPDIALGDKIVFYCTTDAAQSVYKPIKGRIDGTVISELPIMPAAFIKTEASYKVNDYFLLQLVNHDYAYDATKWTITKTGSVTPVVLNQSDKEYQFTETGTYKIEAAVAETPTSGDPVVVETIVTYVEVK